MVSLIDQNTKISVSSVLNRDSKQFGKKHLTDGCVDTAWNSDQGASQWIIIGFERPVELGAVQIQFQGGFGATEVQLLARNGDSETSEEFHLKDTNKEQEIKLKQPIACNQLRINLDGLSDDFGRVIIYKLDALGA